MNVATFFGAHAELLESEDGDGPSEGTFTFQVEEAQGGGWGIWLVWLFALGIPAVISLRPGARRGRDG